MIEQKVAEAILQKPIKIKVGGQAYNVAPPSLATLILVSEEVSTIPKLNIDTENIALESIANAKYAKVLTKCIAIMILGAKKIKGDRGLFKKKNVEVLSNEILENTQPKEVSELFGKLLKGLQVDFFFGTLISLTEINLLKAKTTASGQ